MRKRIAGFIWQPWVIEKLIGKHSVEPEEAEEAFFNWPYKVRRASEGKYLLYGRSEEGRYLFIVFTWEGELVRVITARDMTPSERRYFGGK
ncbi:MAG: BrnT family toxin [Anaerolineae bacterium]